jgi:ABC-2 type transport system permease protein
VSSFVAGTIGMAVIAVVYAVLTFLAGLLAGVDIALHPIVDSAIALLPISMAFGGIATALSAVLRHSGAVTGTVAAVLVVLYLGNTLALLVDSLSWMKWISPFHYYGAPLQQGLDLSDILVLLGIAGFFLAASIPLFARRDVVA